jgi:hypothetical protein
MPSFDVSGNALNTCTEQIGATAVNVGVIFGLTVIVNVAVVAHCPAVGVNVYGRRRRIIQRRVTRFPYAFI